LRLSLLFEDACFEAIFENGLSNDLTKATGFLQSHRDRFFEPE
jgi:hypothetical protein